MNAPVDHAAAAVHRRRAEAHYEAAERFRRIGNDRAWQIALDAGRREDDLADRLEGVGR